MTFKVTFEVPTWSQIYELLLNQAQKLQPCKPDLIVAVARGGTIPARVLSDLLEIPYSSIQVTLYSDIAHAGAEPELKQKLSVSAAGKKVLLVDDIADSGRTLNYAVTYLKEQGAAMVETATLYFKPTCAVAPDYYEKVTSSWVIFPWEYKETLREILQKTSGRRAQSQEIAKLVKAGFPKQIAEKLLAEMQQG
jgi:hypoxanthine phosphoribosyltransferase